MGQKCNKPTCDFSRVCEIACYKKGTGHIATNTSIQKWGWYKEIHKSESNPFVPDNPTLFELDEENFKQIIGAFADLWPITYKGFEDIKNRLPRSVDSTFETRDELEKMDSEKNITEKLKNVLS